MIQIPRRVEVWRQPAAHFGTTFLTGPRFKAPLAGCTAGRSQCHVTWRFAREMFGGWLETGRCLVGDGCERDRSPDLSDLTHIDLER